MKNFFKVLICAAMIFSFSSDSVSAAIADISEDNISVFMTKCNQELKKGDPNNSLDTPELQNTYKIYEETLQVTENIKAKFICRTRDDKVYTIRLKTETFNDEVKNFYEGMSIIFLKALGLTDEDSRELASSKGQNAWQNEKFIPALNKTFKVKVADSELVIFASDKQN